MTMITIERSVELDVPADDAWRVIEDYDNDPSWRSGLVEMTRSELGPPQVGTGVRQTMRAGGTTNVLDTSVVEVGNRCYRFSGSSSLGPIEGSRAVVATEGGSRFTFAVTMQLRGSRSLIAPLVGMVAGRQMQRDLDRLAELMPELAAT